MTRINSLAGILSFPQEAAVDEEMLGIWLKPADAKDS